MINKWIHLSYAAELSQKVGPLQRSEAKLIELPEDLLVMLDDEDGFDEVTDLVPDFKSGEYWVNHIRSYPVGILSKPAHASSETDPKPIGSVSIIVRLCNSHDCDGALPNWPWLDQACLILAWCVEAPVNDEWNYWRIGEFEVNQANRNHIAHVGDGLWVWQKDEQNSSYFFAPPIFALTDEQALKRFVLAPLKALFAAENPEALAKEALSDVPVLMPASE